MCSELTRDKSDQNSLTSRQVSGNVARATTGYVLVCIQRKVPCRSDKLASHVMKTNRCLFRIYFFLFFLLFHMYISF
ncbi:hypothetical protein PUN28_004414 [Cardiocondyla obscurior]|uniref:Uncharacterized protein n=1 Tax=Cardiocondyla obscurior TaxID=286306 RepID=A0AAW2GCJ7_9HYME